MEDEDIVECNDSGNSNLKLCTKKYRVTPKENKWQTYVYATYRDQVRRGETITGIHPIIRQSTMRVDDDRPLNDDGTEKKPWNTDCKLIFEKFE